MPAKLWTVLGYLYDGLFGLQPHRDLVASAAGLVTPGCTTLNIGCGTGMMEKFAPDGSRIISVDFSPSMLARARRRCRYVIQSDMTGLPFRTGQFDLVVCLNVLYAVPAELQAQAVSEAARVLRLGGRLVLANPVTPALLPLVREHFRTATLSGHVRLILNLPRILAWAMVLLVRGLFGSPQFHFQSRDQLIDLVERAGLTVHTADPCYAGIDCEITAKKGASVQTIDFVDPRHPPQALLDILGPFFRDEYSLSPWDERWRCPQCSRDHDFGPAGRFGDPDLTICPVCHTPLEHYWSDVRVLEYFLQAMGQPGAWLIVAWANNGGKDALAAWTWGYDLPSELADRFGRQASGLYVDIVGVVREYRGRQTLRFFDVCRDLLLARSSYLVTRTHRSARHVHLAQLRSGWVRCPSGQSAEDVDREYWLVTALPVAA
jgi:SAM-dependent methyltransferase